MATKPTTYWKCQDVETSGEPKRIRKRLFIDLDRTEDQTPMAKHPKMDKEQTEKTPILKEGIGRNMFLVVSKFHSDTKVHLRVYEEKEDGSNYPTRKGIALDLEKWKKITYYKDEVDSAIDQYDAEMQVAYKQHLGENYYMTIDNDYPVVNIRKWWMPSGNGEIVPTKKGAAITFDQWETLKELMPEVEKKIGDQLKEIEFCENSESHQEQMGFLQCPRCNPNDFSNY